MTVPTCASCPKKIDHGTYEPWKNQPFPIPWNTGKRRYDAVHFGGHDISHINQIAYDYIKKKHDLIEIPFCPHIINIPWNTTLLAKQTRYDKYPIDYQDISWINDNKTNSISLTLQFYHHIWYSSQWDINYHYHIIIVFGNPNLTIYHY